MKKGTMIFSMFAAVLLLAGTAMAAGTNSLAVTGSVVGTCRFSSASSTLGFGALDPSSGANASAAGSTLFWCTKGATYTITNDGGLHNSGGPRMMSTTVVPNEFIPYTLSLAPTTGTGAGPGSPVTLNISGSILFANYANVSADNYSDTVTLTINP